MDEVEYIEWLRQTAYRRRAARRPDTALERVIDAYDQAEHKRLVEFEW